MTQPIPKTLSLTIDRLGAMGDGISEYEGKPVYVPFTCAGDKIKARVKKETKGEIRAQLTSISTPSQNRQDPACQHFGTCGGCSLQHIDEPTYQSFKQGLLESYMKGMGIARNVVAPMVEIKAQSRRRADFKIKLHHDEINIGFFGAGSHTMVDLNECPINEDALSAILPSLRTAISELKKPGRLLSISLTALENGLDARIKLSSQIGTSDKEKLIAFAENSAIIRLNLQVQPRRESRRHAQPEAPICIYDEGNATITLGGVEVSLPSGAFLQATQAGQDAITSLVTEHLKGCENIADLYSGCGTYSFPLIRQSTRVKAFEGADEMAAAMNDACVNEGLDDRIETVMRDLFSDPLSTEELNYFDGIVINPPRNGALPQVKAIAQSSIRKIVMVSCDPATFKRDAKCLLDAGYTLTLAVPIDQFYWSRHLELVAVFEK